MWCPADTVSAPPRKYSEGTHAPSGNTVAVPPTRAANHKTENTGRDIEPHAANHLTAVHCRSELKKLLDTGRNVRVA